MSQNTTEAMLKTTLFNFFLVRKMLMPQNKVGVCENSTALVANEKNTRLLLTAEKTQQHWKTKLHSYKKWPLDLSKKLITYLFYKVYSYLNHTL